MSRITRRLLETLLRHVDGFDDPDDGRPGVQALRQVPAYQPVSRPLSLAARIAYHEHALEVLRIHQRDTLLRLIVTVFGQGVFTSVQVWQHPELQAACREAGITSVQELGNWWRVQCPRDVSRVTRDELGTVYVACGELHEAPRYLIDDDV